MNYFCNFANLMNRPNITIRKATPEDAILIAQVVGMAIGEKSMPHYCGNSWMNVIAHIARQENTQYSYRNTLVAEVDGVRAGAIIGYDGAQLHALRQPTFDIILQYVDKINITEDETEAGEYYLDSIGVLPEYRKIGIATKLIEAMRDKIFAEGHTKFGLIVDFDNPTAERLYTQIGFRRVGQRTFLGHKMWHLVYEQ